MKRTREVINYSHPGERWNLSGALVFDGEDRDEEARKNHQKQMQRQALLDQMAENKRTREMEKEHDR